jgi:hypothetical protein
MMIPFWNFCAAFTKDGPEGGKVTAEMRNFLPYRNVEDV